MPVHHRQIEFTHRFSANRSSEAPLPPRGPAFPATVGGTKGIPLPCPCYGLKQDSAVCLTWWVHEPSVGRQGLEAAAGNRRATKYVCSHSQGPLYVDPGWATLAIN